MAGDWLKFDLTTPDKPEVHSIAAALQITPEECVGRLILIWRWFNQQSRDGYAPVTLGALSKIAKLEGFAEAVEKEGWLSTGKKGVCVTNFDRHNGKSAKSRALAKDRMQRMRYAPVTQNASPEKKERIIPPNPLIPSPRQHLVPCTGCGKSKAQDAPCSYCELLEQSRIAGRKFLESSASQQQVAKAEEPDIPF